MGAYSSVNGEPACANKYLLQDILLNEWGFKGHIVSDCWAIKDFHTGHKVTKDVVESSALAINRGVDLNCGDSYPSLNEAVINSDAHGEIAHEVAVKSLILLKNNGALPLDKEIHSIFVAGPQANNSDVMLGNYYGQSHKVVNILEGITSRVSTSNIYFLISALNSLS